MVTGFWKSAGLVVGGVFAVGVVTILAIDTCQSSD
jgi:hypothetical protein